MAVEFHHEDIPAQDFLDDLHAINIPGLYDPTLTSEQRRNLLVRGKQRLNEWHRELLDQMKAIEARDSADNGTQETRLLLAPYRKLDELARDLNKALLELERIVKAGRVVPEGFRFGTQIFGELERGEWMLGEYEDARLYEDYAAIRRRMEDVAIERQPLIKKIKVAQARIKEQQNDIMALRSTHKRRSGFLDVLVRLLPVLLVVIVALASGWYIYRNPEPMMENLSNQAIGGMLLVVGTVGTIAMIVLYRRRKRHLNILSQDIRAGKQRLKQLQQAYKKARMDFYPTDELYKELRTEYEDLKAAFP